MHRHAQSRFWRRLVLCLGFLVWAVPGLALEAPADPADIILTVDGEIAVRNSEAGAVFDRALLRAIGWREVTTHSPFLEGENRFGGVPVADFLAVLGVQGGHLQAAALDGYTVTLPVAEVLARDALFAMEHEGRAMRVRNRGPIWLVYPMTAEEAAAGVGEGRMIWQLQTITVRP